MIFSNPAGVICVHQEEIANALKDVLASIRLQERGVYVQASTLGSLEALLEFLRTSKIPVSPLSLSLVVERDFLLLFSIS